MFKITVQVNNVIVLYEIGRVSTAIKIETQLLKYFDGGLYLSLFLTVKLTMKK